MYQTSHGGWCCGMTHIHGFPTRPSDTMSAQTRLTSQQVTARNIASPVYSLRRNHGFPEQTALARLKEIIRGIEEGTPQDLTDVYVYQAARPMGCIEVVLTNNQCQYWQDTLLTLGFRIVNTFVNSNSTRRIKVFHRNSGEKGVQLISSLKDEATPVTATPPASPAPIPTPG
jgi:hypothetical protein